MKEENVASKTLMPVLDMPHKNDPLIVKAIAEFTCTINGSVRSFTIGQVERDYISAKHLIDTGCPVRIVSKEEADQLNDYQCPKCRHIFKV
jgi:hypothetical protein